MINADHEPVEGIVPLARLRPGTFVRDAIHVTLPARLARRPHHAARSACGAAPSAPAPASTPRPTTPSTAATVTVAP